MMTAIECVDLIDKKFFDAKKRRLSRFDTEWGLWSAKMNSELRQRINSKEDSEERALKHVILYWTVKSKILESFHESALFQIGKRKKLEKEAADHKKFILSGKFPDIDFHKEFMKSLNV